MSLERAQTFLELLKLWLESKNVQSKFVPASTFLGGVSLRITGAEVSIDTSADGRLNVYYRGNLTNFDMCWDMTLFESPYFNPDNCFSEMLKEAFDLSGTLAISINNNRNILAKTQS